jgi:hypothetical protein
MMAQVVAPVAVIAKTVNNNFYHRETSNKPIFEFQIK